MPAIRMINIAGADFIEIPEITFFGREFLIRVNPGDNPVALAVEVCKTLKNVMTRAKLSPIVTGNTKIIKPN